MCENKYFHMAADSSPPSSSQSLQRNLMQNASSYINDVCTIYVFVKDAPQGVKRKG